MELCTVTLDGYLRGYDRSIILGSETSIADGVFVSKTCKPVEGAYNIWRIMSHIAMGLEFLHSNELAHRDLKPSNGQTLSFGCLILVLYSSLRSNWKIADFGITSAAASSKANPTMYARGTSGYRAPELLQDEATFTTRVDIWSLGCILGELATGWKLFENDTAVRDWYATKETFSILPSENVYKFYNHVVEIGHVALNRESSKRFNSLALSRLFSSYCTMHVEFGDNGYLLLSCFPGFKIWFSMHTAKKPDLLSNLADWYRSCGEYTCASVCNASLVREFPTNTAYIQALHRTFVKSKGDMFSSRLWSFPTRLELRTWLELLQLHPYQRKIRDAFLSSAHQAIQIHGPVMLKEFWARLPENDPSGVCAELLADLFAKSEEEAAMGLLQKILFAAPENTTIQAQLRQLLIGSTNRRRDLSMWQRLLIENPQSTTLFEELKLSCGRAGDEDMTIESWAELVLHWPQQNTFITELKSALWSKGDEIYAVTTWARITVSNFSPALVPHLSEAIRTVGNAGNIYKSIREDLLNRYDGDEKVVQTVVKMDDDIVRWSQKQRELRVSVINLLPR